MGPLFAPAPVGSAAEEALWEIDYEPQELWDRLVDTWRRPGVERSRKAILLRQLGRLLRPANPHHRARMHQRGFLLHDLRGFDADLEGLEAELAREDGPWRAFPHAAQDLATLRSRIAAEGVLPRESDGEREPAPPPPEPPARPAGVTLAGLPPGAEWEGPEWEQDTEAESLGARTLELLRPWWNYLPAILLGWLMVELTGGRAPDGQRGMLQVFFLLFVLVATGAGATASAGISEVGLARTLLHRLSVIGEFLYLGLLAFLMVLGYVALAMPFDPGLDHPWHRFGIAVAALLPLARLWPFWMIPFMQPVERDLKRVESLGNYRRPAMATAWRMTREPGTLRTRTLPWLLAFGAALAMTALATHLGGAAGRSLVLYPLVLPTLAAFTWALIEPMPDREMD